MTRSEKIIKEIEEKMKPLSNGTNTDYLIFYNAVFTKKLLERLDEIEWLIKESSSVK